MVGTPWRNRCGRETHFSPIREAFTIASQCRSILHPSVKPHTRGPAHLQPWRKVALHIPSQPFATVGTGLAGSLARSSFYRPVFSSLQRLAAGRAGFRGGLELLGPVVQATANLPHGLAESMFVLNQRQPQVAFSSGTEAAAGTDRHVPFFE